jgi:hypothetical protein
MDPALQVEHEATAEDNEYKPGLQESHLIAPLLVPVFVMDPGLQTLQSVFSVSSWNLPTGQIVQDNLSFL